MLKHVLKYLTINRLWTLFWKLFGIPKSKCMIPKFRNSQNYTLQKPSAQAYAYSCSTRNSSNMWLRSTQLFGSQCRRFVWKSQLSTVFLWISYFSFFHHFTLFHTVGQYKLTRIIRRSNVRALLPRTRAARHRQVQLAIALAPLTRGDVTWQTRHGCVYIDSIHRWC